MSWRTEQRPAPVSTQEAFQALTIDSLKPFARLLVAGELPKRKGELVSLVAGAMREPERVRALYDGLDALGRAAVQEAAHDREGRLNADRFEAKYGRTPDFREPSPDDDGDAFYYGRRTAPTALALFFPKDDALPTDLRTLLLTFVPEPQPYALPTREEPPAALLLTWREWEDGAEVEESEEKPLRVRETAREALHDLKAVLRVVESRRIRVSDKKRQPTAASRQAVADVLLDGDFYTAEDQDESKYDPAFDLAIKAFAWPMIVQAAGLTQKTGDDLTLTPAGRKALSKPAPEVLRAAWHKWRTTTLLDEFSRVEAIKGQGKARLSALASRRKAVLDGLSKCPVGRWFTADDFFRFLRATDRDFVLAHRGLRTLHCGAPLRQFRVRGRSPVGNVAGPLRPGPAVRVRGDAGAGGRGLRAAAGSPRRLSGPLGHRRFVVPEPL